MKIKDVELTAALDEFLKNYKENFDEYREILWFHNKFPQEISETECHTLFFCFARQCIDIDYSEKYIQRPRLAKYMKKTYGALFGDYNYSHIFTWMKSRILKVWGIKVN